MTGQDIYRLAQQQCSQAYTGFLSVAKFNRLMPKSISQSIEDKYRTLSTQKNYDEIRNFISTEQELGIVNPNTNLSSNSIFLGDSTSLPVGTPVITDYLHLLAVKAYFEIPTYLSFEVSNTTPIVLTFAKRNNIRNEQMTISGVGGTTNANGTYYLRKLNQLQFALYQDKNFQTAVAGNGAYTSGGTIARTFYEYAKQLVSDRKISVLTSPDPYNPYFEIANGYLKIYPLEFTCNKITIDYIKVLLTIDPTNTTFNYETYYPLKFIHYIVDKFTMLFGAEERDTPLVQLTQSEIQQNP